MKIIKRYPNRKLYDTEKSQYITLEDIVSFISEGIEFKVIDNKNKEDITSLILSQIIYESEKRKQRLMPIDFMKKIIQYGEDAVQEMFGKLNIGDKIGFKDAEKKFKDLFKKGEEGKGKLKEFISGAQFSVQDFEKKIDSAIQEAISRVPGLSEIINELKELRNELKNVKKRVGKIEKNLKN